MSEIISNIGDIGKVVNALKKALESMQKITLNEDGAKCLKVINECARKLELMMENTPKAGVAPAPATTTLPSGPR